jgi:hypothetical protein
MRPSGSYETCGWKARLLVGLVAFCLPGAVALAQPRGKPASKPPKPAPAAKADAHPAEEADGGAEKAAPATTASDAPAPPPSEPGDGGRWSPLNPEPQELPNAAVLADAGVPVDYDRLLADIAALRARIAAVADNLYHSRISIALQLDNGHAKVGKLTVSLDDGVVFTAPPSFAASDLTPVYDHAVAPGRHAITVDVDRRDARDETFRTSQRSRFIVDVPRDHRVEVQVRVIDDSSMGGDFPSDRSGKYDLRLRVKAVAKPVGK